ncbi:HGGxSTG domain-containing protein [Caenispirillum salinarum]|uniref:HGGxSTG domain-containing protein n=1 Tax=Caenispirillum salinarum TaxID=859058 RepID=UPI0009FCFB5F
MKSNERPRAPALAALDEAQAAPRCGAKTRSGGACRAPAVTGRRRCRMHGGAPGSGAPLGNQNARKHGRYSAAAKEERRLVRSLIREMRAFNGTVR